MLIDTATIDIVRTTSQENDITGILDTLTHTYIQTAYAGAGDIFLSKLGTFVMAKLKSSLLSQSGMYMTNGVKLEVNVKM